MPLRGTPSLRVFAKHSAGQQVSTLALTDDRAQRVSSHCSTGHTQPPARLPLFDNSNSQRPSPQSRDRKGADADAWKMYGAWGKAEGVAPAFAGARYNHSPLTPPRPNCGTNAERKNTCFSEQSPHAFVHPNRRFFYRNKKIAKHSRNRAFRTHHRARVAQVPSRHSFFPRISETGTQAFVPPPMFSSDEHRKYPQPLHQKNGRHRTRTCDPYRVSESCLSNIPAKIE